MKETVKTREKHDLKSWILRELNFANYKNDKNPREQNFANSNLKILSILPICQKFVELRNLILAKIYSLKEQY